MKIKKNQDGITLLITLLLMGVFLGISSSLLNITLKQFQLSGIVYASEVAFQAANAGVECIQYNDWVGTAFEISTVLNPRNHGSITCFDGITDIDFFSGAIDSGEEQKFEFSWPRLAPTVCTDVSVYKFEGGAPLVVSGGINVRPSDPNCGSGPGVTCTVIQSRGYNVACGDIGSGGRVVEREYTVVY